MRKLIAVLLAATGCSGSGHSPTTMPPATPTLQSIALSPATATLSAANGAAATQQFTAVGTYSDGHTADVTASASWTLSDSGVGSIAGGSFMAAGTRGGAVVVTAGDGTLSATATLVVKWSSTRVSGDDGSTAPANAPTLFAGGTDTPALAPTLAYPLDGARVPNNLGLIEVQWKPQAGDLFEVSFESATTDYKVYTNALQPSGGRLSLHPDEWTSIAQSNKGATVAVKVRALASAQPSAIGSSASVTLAIAEEDVMGGIYYFAPVSASGDQVGTIMRHSFGDTSSPATTFYAPTGSGGKGRCVGCHVLTRDGGRVGVTYDGGGGPAAELDVATLAGLIPESKGAHWTFASFAPDGQRMVGTSGGALYVYDSSGGAANGTITQTLTDGSSGHYASHPDWSPDGSKIAYVAVGAPNGATEWTFGKGSIVVVSDSGQGSFGAPQTIVQSQGENNYYPSFSPDGKWILFNRGSNSAYNDATAELWVVASDGSGGPIQLAKANAVGNLTNSWPRWSPFVQHEDGQDRLYFHLLVDARLRHRARRRQSAASVDGGVRPGGRRCRRRPLGRPVLAPVPGRQEPQPHRAMGANDRAVVDASRQARSLVTRNNRASPERRRNTRPCRESSRCRGRRTLSPGPVGPPLQVPGSSGLHFSPIASVRWRDIRPAPRRD